MNTVTDIRPTSRVTLSRGPILLSGAVMTHPARLAAAERLRDALPELGLVIALDPDPGKPGSAARNAQRAWGMAAPAATHHLVLQDDADPCPRFVPTLLDAVAERPEAAISLFTEWGSQTSYAVRLAVLLGSRWAPVLDPYTPTVGLVLPAAVARAFSGEAVLFADQDDVSMAALLRRSGVESWVTVPNLLDHAAQDSLVGNDYMGPRHAAHLGPWGAAAFPLDDVRADIPYLEAITGRAMVARRVARPEDRPADQDTDQPADRSLDPLAEFFDRHGIDRLRAGRLGPGGAAAAEALRAAGVPGEAQACLGRVRSVVYALGFQAGRLGSHAEPADPGVLDTIPQGALRGWLTADQINTLIAPLRVLLNESAAAGFEHGRQERSR